MENRRPKFRFLLLMMVTLASCQLFYLCYRYDNKYMQYHPYVKLGVTEPDMAWYDKTPFFYLVDGWAFYQDKLLSPEEAATHTPDAYFYLGRYGGFNLGEPDGNPHGQATYRMVVLLDGLPRQYALELPPIFSRWRLWINGTLVQSVGMGDENVSGLDSTTAVFKATNQIEIVVAVADEGSYYTGMVYPPALGSPASVNHVLSVRLLLHGGACILALALGMVCLCAGRLLRFARPYQALSLLCFCLAGATAGPVLRTFGILWTSSPGQRACFYGIFLSLLWTVGQVCELPQKLQWTAAGIGGAVCAAMLIQPLFPIRQAWSMLALSGLLGLYKLLSAFYLLGASGWALYKKKRGSCVMLCSGVLFATALGMDRLLPVYEPIYGGWFVEVAGWLLLGLIGSAALWDTVTLYRSDQILRTELAVRAEHAKLQQEYVRDTRERLHENHSQLTLITHYLDTGRLDDLRAYLNELAPNQPSDPGQYTGNLLVDAILSVQLIQANREGIYVDLDLALLPEVLPYADEDLTSIMMNLLDNALEANMRLPDKQARWLSLCITAVEGGIEIICQNAAPPQDRGRTSKSDSQAHGFGLPLLRKIAARYGGNLEVDRLDNCCAVTITLYVANKREETTV